MKHISSLILMYNQNRIGATERLENSKVRQMSNERSGPVRRSKLGFWMDLSVDV
ncbi:hypothetical protein DAPPUDRAFT_246490 [Daphnia pulex]|uniref:Uncharacterized protein n=1 Tax=Daphnia pulex TaxID=6669 RepID=E9GQM9_DAPPU|nr:hypothetical protein DAPPUDRAFT_246490 [Daphnia pulex]|eukprot:EFX78300.1 hypothetical protein DAPPUDRAFT_246490 [Daphnia pulex]